jgi:hypothetical protein
VSRRSKPSSSQVLPTTASKPSSTKVLPSATSKSVFNAAPSSVKDKTPTYQSSNSGIKQRVSKEGRKNLNKKRPKTVCCDEDIAVVLSEDKLVANVISKTVSNENMTEDYNTIHDFSITDTTNSDTSSTDEIPSPTTISNYKEISPIPTHIPDDQNMISAPKSRISVNGNISSVSADEEQVSVPTIRVPYWITPPVRRRELI